jgi:hypothetical protein
LHQCDAHLACEEENYLENFFFLLLVKIKKFQNKNLTTLKIRKQLMLDNTRDVCAKREWSIYKKVLFFFHAILISNEAFLKEKLLRLHYDDSLARHFEIKKTRTLISKKFYWLKMTLNIDAYIRRYNIC